MILRAASMKVAVAALAACANAEEPIPATESELASSFLSALVTNDTSKLKQYAAQDLRVGRGENGSSLEELLSELENSNCAVIESSEPRRTESKVRPGSRPYLSSLSCKDDYESLVGGMQIELSVDDMRVSDVNWYFLTIRVPS